MDYKNNELINQRVSCHIDCGESSNIHTEWTGEAVASPGPVGMQTLGGDAVGGVG